MKKIKKLLVENKLLVAILLLGLFLRIYKPAELFMYGHDHDLAGWFVRDVLVNKHLRLIGQETSTQGIFIGPLYYYLLIPFYIMFGMDPIGGVFLMAILGVFSIWSVYFVFSKVFKKNNGLIAAFIYSVSFYTIFNDREVVPTVSVILWTVWFFYGLNLLLKGKQKKGFLVLGILIGLIWHLNMALVLLIPLIPLFVFLSKKKFDFKSTFKGLMSVALLSVPLVLFELRHGFSQTKWFVKSLTTHQYAIISGYDQFRRVIHLLSKNASALIWGSFDDISYETTLILFFLVFMALAIKKTIKKNHAIMIIFWLILYVGFFSVYSKTLSEYYLNGTIVIWIIILTRGISYLFSRTKYKKLGVVILAMFSILNLNKFFNLNINYSGYVAKKAIVAEIKKDSAEKEYPCVAVSYIVNPGYDLGYRYFFFLADLHVNKPNSGSPVYSIVFPLRDDIEVDETFGAIGLIYPENSRYNRKEIEISCSGENTNLIDSMWGLTN